MDEARCWVSQFEKLVLAYKDKNGDCVARCAGKYLLGNWARKQRRQYKLHSEGKPSPLTPSRMERLEGLGFMWNSPRCNKQSTTPVDWKTRFQELCQYREKNGSCDVPNVCPQNPGPLRTAWVQKQRYKYSSLLLKGRTPRITKEHVDALESIGFSWSLRGARNVGVADQEAVNPESAAKACTHQCTKRSAGLTVVSVVLDENKLNPKAVKRRCGVEAARASIKANGVIRSSRAAKDDPHDVKLAKVRTLIQSLLQA